MPVEPDASCHWRKSTSGAVLVFDATFAKRKNHTESDCKTKFIEYPVYGLIGKGSISSGKTQSKWRLDNKAQASITPRVQTAVLCIQTEEVDAKVAECKSCRFISCSSPDWLLTLHLILSSSMSLQGGTSTMIKPVCLHLPKICGGTSRAKQKNDFISWLLFITNQANLITLTPSTGLWLPRYQSFISGGPPISSPIELDNGIVHQLAEIEWYGASIWGVQGGEV